VPCVLIVEDEPDLARVLEFNFAQAGFETISAHGGEEALSKLRQRVPDLILLDLMLPDVAGTEVCRKLKGNPRTRDVPVILEWTDVVGVLAATRHCRRPVVTASIEGTELRAPIRVGERVAMTARVAYTSQRSVGVSVSMALFEEVERRRALQRLIAGVLDRAA
jgi:DNA-binding response OmpR family regulator